MAMTTGTSRSTINVTPLIDILLVLLIIFMVITPTQSVGLEAAVPQPAAGAPPAVPTPASSIVVEIDRDRNLTINTTPVEPGSLADRLREIFQSRNTRLVFVKADGDLEFQHVARTIDTIKSAGIERVGLLGKAL